MLRLINKPRDVRATTSVVPAKPMSEDELRKLNVKVSRQVAAIQSAQLLGDKQTIEYLPTREPGVSLLRRWMGDMSYDRIIYAVGPDPAQLHQLFPEAIIVTAKP